MKNNINNIETGNDEVGIIKHSNVSKNRHLNFRDFHALVYAVSDLPTAEIVEPTKSKVDEKYGANLLISEYKDPNHKKTKGSQFIDIMKEIKKHR